MDTSDAEQLMMPFFPHDPYLAVRSLARAMFETEGVDLPEWIWEAVVQQYFTYLQIQKMQLKHTHVRDQLSAEDPFKMQSVPYFLLQYPSMN